MVFIKYLKTIKVKELKFSHNLGLREMYSVQNFNAVSLRMAEILHYVCDLVFIEYLKNYNT